MLKEWADFGGELNKINDLPESKRRNSGLDRAKIGA